MEGKKSSRLYFSLLPSHLNKYFRKKYLAPDCDIIWDYIYKCGSIYFCHRKTLILYLVKNGYTSILLHIKRNNGSIMKYLEANERVVTKGFGITLYTYASIGNHVETLKFLQEEFETEIVYNVAHAAAKHGSLDILKYIYEKNAPLLDDIWNIAAEYGHIHVLEWLVDNNLKVSKGGGKYDGAIKGDGIEVIKWIYAAGYPWEPHMLSIAIAYCSYRVLEWLLITSCPKTIEEIRRASAVIITYKEHYKVNSVL